VKRLLVISLLVVVVLAMTVSTAFASTCGSGCTSAMACNVTLSGACPMSAPSALSPSCSHPDQRQGREASALQHQQPGATAVTVTSGFAAPPTCKFASTPLAPDARGAPHLTAVIRI
jgi:hypothetical protein